MDKLEKHIKQSLEKRQIQPSDTAWSSIESQLGDSKESGPGVSKIRYAVAAVFLGAVFALSLFWIANSDTTTAEKIQLVDTKSDIEELVNENKTDILVNNEQESNEEEVGQKVIQLAQENVVKDDSNKIASDPSQQVVGASDLNDGFLEKEQLIIDEKVNEVFAKVALLENANDAVTNAEVDSLLRAAQKEILADRIFKENGSVDAMALLTEVEDELDQTFRDQLFEALKDGYTKLKTAVADRNN